jgi:hypothetical protein
MRRSRSPERAAPGHRSGASPAVFIDHGREYGHTLYMATTTVRSTYALDPETVGLLERLARQWAVSKSEALRRAIRAAAERTAPDDRAARVAAWHQLQKGVGLTPARARAWERQVVAERRAWRQPRG